MKYFSNSFSYTIKINIHKKKKLFHQNTKNIMQYRLTLNDKFNYIIINSFYVFKCSIIMYNSKFKLRVTLRNLEEI